MASLKDIRRRITSVKSTQQITKAMKMVAAAKLRRAQEMITNARPYAQKIDDLSARLMLELARKTESMKKDEAKAYLLGLHPLLRKSSESPKKIALLIVSSDRGLCGAYNTNLFKHAWVRFQEITAENSGNKPSLFFVGNKARSNFFRREEKGELFQNFWQGSFTRVKANEVADRFIGGFVAGDFDQVEIVYTEFVSALSQVQKTKVLLPLSVDSQLSDDTTRVEGEEVLPFLYKPDQKKLLKNLLTAQVQTQFFRCFADSLASEFGSRMTSMDNATRNASDMIRDLTLKANRVRQAAITTELTEIVSGAEALKG